MLGSQQLGAGYPSSRCDFFVNYQRRRSYMRTATQWGRQVLGQQLPLQWLTVLRTGDTTRRPKILRHQRGLQPYLRPHRRWQGCLLGRQCSRAINSAQRPGKQRGSIHPLRPQPGGGVPGRTVGCSPRWKPLRKNPLVAKSAGELGTCPTVDRAGSRETCSEPYSPEPAP